MSRSRPIAAAALAAVIGSVLTAVPAGAAAADEDLGQVTLGTTSATRTVTVTAPVDTTYGAATITGADADSFVVVDDACAGAELVAGASCTVGVAAHPVSEGALVATLTVPSADGDQVVSLTAVGVDTPEGTFTPLPQQRILDMRTGNGTDGSTAPLGQQVPIDLQVTGRGGVPATGVDAVVLNITAVTPARKGYLTAYPTGEARPKASSVNWGWGGRTAANLVTVRVGDGGKVRLWNYSGEVHVLADVVGVYNTATSATADRTGFVSLTPTRLVDTRTADWGSTKLPSKTALWTTADFGPDFNDRVEALALNITVVKPERYGHVTAFDGEDTSRLGSTSNVNFYASGTGSATPNMAVVKVGRCSVDCGDPTVPIPMIGLYNASLKPTHIVIDAVGVYFREEPGEYGWRYHSLPAPTRFVDSRLDLGVNGPLQSFDTRDVSVPDTIAGDASMAVVSNLTATDGRAETVFTIWAADGTPRPTASNLNPFYYNPVSNMAMIGLGEGNVFRLWNRLGPIDAVIDAAGTMEYYPVPAAGAGGAAAGALPSEAAAEVAEGPAVEFMGRGTGD